MHSGMHRPRPQQHGLDSSTTEAPISSLLSRQDVLLSLDRQTGGKQPQEAHCLQTPRSPRGGIHLLMESSSRMTPKGTQPPPKQKETAQQQLESKAVPSGFVLSADAPPYTPQSSTAKHLQGLHSTTASCIIAEPSGLGFIRAFSSPAAPPPKEEYLQQRTGTSASDLGTAHPAASSHLRVVQVEAAPAAPSETQQQLASAFGNCKTAGNVNPLAASSTVPLKFCKFLIGEDVAGFLVGRKGVGALNVQGY